MTLKELSLELPALKDEAKHVFGENYPAHLVMMIYSDDAVKYLKENVE